MDRPASRSLPAGSLRARLFLLVLLAVIPAGALLGYLSLERQQLAQARASTELLHLAQLIADNQEQRIASTRDLLSALARMPELQRLDPVPCHERLAAMLPLYPQYAGMAVADLNGDTLCASSGVTSTINVADRLYFQRALETQDFAVGEYQIGRNIGRPVLAFGYPVYSPDGRLGGVLLTTIELATLNRSGFNAPLPPEAVLTIVDRNGLIMVREPGAAEWIGQPLPEPALAQAIRTGGAGVVETDGEDGVRRLYAYTPLEGLPNVELFVSVGLPRAVAFAEANQQLTRNLLWAAAIVALMLLATWVWSQFSILRPVRALSAAADRLRQGDLRARTGLTAGQDELSGLARTFDDMAATLARRDAALHAEREWLRVTLAGIGDAVIATDQEGRVAFMNAIAQDLTRWSEPDAVGRPIEEVFHIINEATRARVESPVTRVLRDGMLVGLANHTLLVTRDGREIPVDDSGAPIRDASGDLLGVVLVFRDVTERRQAEAQLHAAKQQLEKTFASLDQAIFVVDPQTRIILSANPAVERVFGYPLEAVIGRSTECLHVDSEHYEQLGQQLFPALDQGRVFQTEYAMRRQDGTVFPAEITVTEFRDEAGQRTGMVSVVRDVTERQQAADRTARLLRVSAALTPVLEADEVVRVIVQESAASLGASASAIFLAAEDYQSLRLMESVGYSAPIRQALARLPVDGSTPGADVFRSREALWLRSNAELVARYPALAATRSATQNEAVAVIPLLIGGQALGVLALSFAQPREFEQDERDFLQTLAGHCALALERSRLYGAEQQARRAAEQAADRTARLQAVTASLSSALLPEAVARVIIEQGLEALGAAAGLLVTLVAGEHSLSMLHAKGYPPGYLEHFIPMGLDAAYPIAAVARTGQPLWLRSQAELAALYPKLGGLRQPHALQATAVAPLLFEARVLGVLTFSFALEQAFAPEDQALLLALAGAGAQALERARLYQEAHTLNAELEQRVQARTEALEVAVEELRVANLELERQIAERKLAEAQVRQSERRLAEAQQVARLGSWYWDVTTDSVTWSEELCRIYGVSPTDPPGSYEGFLERVHPEDRDLVRDRLANAFQDHQPFTFDHRILRPDGSVRTLNARGEVILNAAGRLAAMRGTGQDITERKEIEDELRTSREQLVLAISARQRALQQLEQGREEERARIAREVHDELGGALTGLKMDLSRLRKAANMPNEAREQLVRLAEEVDATTQIVRRIAQELRPAVLDDFGLLAALEAQFKDFLHRSGLAGELVCPVEELTLPGEAAIACYRIFQEALTNVARHAQATRVDVSLTPEDDYVVLRVADNGRGLDPADQVDQGHLGLVGMRERAALIGAALDIASAPGQGAVVTLKIPLTPN